MFKLINLIIFIVSSAKTIELLMASLSRRQELTSKGFKSLGLFGALLIVNTLQLFGVFDFIEYLMK